MTVAQGEAELNARTDRILEKRRWLLERRNRRHEPEGPPRGRISPEARSAKGSPMKRATAGWWFVAPALAVIGIFFVLPVVAALLVSFTDFDIYALADIHNLRFVGLRNYVRLLETPLFWHALGNTLYFVVVGVPLSIAASLGAALLLDSRLARATSFFRTALFVPVVTTLVAVAVIWRYLLNTRYGLINYALGRLGVGPIDWLGDPHWAMPAIILFAVWKSFGYNMVILFAGLQSIPRELYEAARMDGASAVQQFRYITRAVPRPDPAHGQHPDDRRSFSALRGAVRDDAGRAAAKHRERALLHVRRRLQVVEPRQRFGGRVPAVPVDLRRDRRAALARAATRRRRMSARADVTRLPHNGP